MQVLVHFAQHPGEVLTKEQVIEAVWPDTFVSEQALTRCISVLRREMQDDAHTPRYIQTISKSGYRLVAEVRMHQVETPHPPSEPHLASEPPANGTIPKIDLAATAPAPVSRRRYWIWGAASALLAVAGVASFFLWRMGQSADLPPFRVIALTSYAGQQDQGAFSPAGNSVAFVWTSPEDGNRNIFVKHIGDETTLRLTNGPEADYSPTWSPDGTRIAFLASSDKGLGIFQVSSFGGPVTRLYTPQGIIHWEQGALSWSPDGKTIAFPDGVSSRSPSAIYLQSLESLQARPLTAPPAEWDGDFDPAFSNDGKRIAFIRASDYAVRDIYVIPAGGGEARQITHDGRIVDSLCWSPDDKSILFSSDRAGKFALWRVSVRGGEPERLPVGTEDAFQPAFSPVAHRLLYTQSSATWSILAIPLRPGVKAGSLAPVISSTAQDSAPSLAPDGSRIAFQSWRSGTQEIWITSRDGKNIHQLTSDGDGLTGSPSFSPDGMWVAFDSRVEGHSHIFVVPAVGGAPRRITAGDSNNILPRWSADGKSLYFASNRNGTWQSWRVPVAGGNPQQVTANGGYVAMESPDGRWVYFTKGDLSGIWRMPITGGAEQHVLPQPRGGYWGYWCMGRRGIYLLDTDPPAPRIVLYDFSTRRTSTIATLDHSPPPYAGLTVDRNENELLMTDERNVGSHLTLVENMR